LPFNIYIAKILSIVI